MTTATALSPARFLGGREREQEEKYEERKREEEEEVEGGEGKRALCLDSTRYPINIFSKSGLWVFPYNKEI